MFRLHFRSLMVFYLLAYSSFGCNQRQQLSRSHPEIRPGQNSQSRSTPRPNHVSTIPPKRPRPSDPDPRCTLRISELNTDSIGRNDHQFIELSMKCETRSGPIPKNPLVGHRLMIFKANPLQLVLVYNFDNPEFQVKDKNEFVTIGSPGVENLDVSLKSPHVKNVLTNSFNINLIPSGLDDEYTVVLAFSQSKIALKASS